MIRRAVSLAAVVLVALAVPAAAAAWKFLGERAVTDRLDHDVIAVTGAEGHFDAIQIGVARVAVQFHAVTIHFANGGDQQVELKNVIAAGQRSRVIDIAGRDRTIRSVEFWYDSQSLKGKQGVVKLWGRR